MLAQPRGHPGIPIGVVFGERLAVPSPTAAVVGPGNSAAESPGVTPASTNCGARPGTFGSWLLLLEAENVRLSLVLSSSV
jgi:hypothetical protein